MRIPRVYISQVLAENSRIELSGDVVHYLKNVMRMKVGREAIFFNGDGNEFLTVIVAIEKKRLVVDVGKMSTPAMESPLSIHLGCCLIKNDRMDWLLQKATELGVASFSPLFSEYTDTKIPQARLEKKIEHWQQVIISACEQSGRTHLPKIGAPQVLTAWMESTHSDFKAVLHPYHAQPLQANQTLGEVRTIALLVGPEGGFSEAEIAAAHAHQFHSISLGPRILRAETAPLAALSLLQHYFGDL